MGHITLDEVINAAMQLPDDQREMLVSILQMRQIEARRREIAMDAQKSLADSARENLRRRRRRMRSKNYRKVLRKTNEKVGSYLKIQESLPQIRQKGQLLQKRFDDTLRQMSEDAFVSLLSTHKLSGSLSGLWACSCGYDCRIVFSVETDEHTGEEVILLLDIGTHDEVY